MKTHFKHKLALVSMLFATVFSFSSIYAEDFEDVILSLQINNPIMTVNGVDMEIDSLGDTSPVVVDGRTLVPVRAIVESFGGNVNWNSSSRTVTLSLNQDEINMAIESNTAYLNNTPYTLDVAPTVINERTMLPIRFIAEGFNLGVAWNSETQKVYIVKNTFSDDDYTDLISIIPEYSYSPYVQINDNIPFFESYEIIDAPFEYYSTLDDLVQNGQAHLLVLADRDVGCVKIEIRIKQRTRFMHKQRGGLQKGSFVDIFKQSRLDRLEECVRIRHGDFRFSIGGIGNSAETKDGGEPCDTFRQFRDRGANTTAGEIDCAGLDLVADRIGPFHFNAVRTAQNAHQRTDEAGSAVGVLTAVCRDAPRAAHRVFRRCFSRASKHGHGLCMY